MEKINQSKQKNKQVVKNKKPTKNSKIKTEEGKLKNLNKSKVLEKTNKKNKQEGFKKSKKQQSMQQGMKIAGNEKKEAEKIKNDIAKQKLKNEKFKKYEASEDNKQIKQELQKKNKTTKILLISLIATALTLFISAGCNIELGIELNRANILDKITFTKNVEITLDTGNSGVGSVTLPNNILPGAGYNQTINFTTKTLNHSLVMRAKAVFTDVMGIINDASIIATPNWQQGSDGYYYFNGVVNSNNSYLFSTEVILPEEITQSNNNKNIHVLTFICENTRYDNASASVIWENAPTAWLLTYGSGFVS